MAEPVGVDLMLLPLTVDQGDVAFAYTTLEVERRRELWPLIRALPSYPVPPRFDTLLSERASQQSEEWGWVQGDTHVDDEGKPLVCVLARDLQALSGHPAVQDHHLNRAVWAYLAQLPGEMRVALYWA